MLFESVAMHFEDTSPLAEQVRRKTIRRPRQATLAYTPQRRNIFGRRGRTEHRNMNKFHVNQMDTEAHYPILPSRKPNTYMF